MSDLFVTGFPSVSAAVGTYKSYVIYDANPHNVSETDGADAYPSGAYEKYCFAKKRVNGASSLKYTGEETPCYVLEFDSESDHDKALIENGFMCNDGENGRSESKIAVGHMGWMQYPEIMRAVKDYVYVSYDIYVEDEKGRDITLTVSPMYWYLDAWKNDPQSNSAVFDSFAVTQKNEWISRSVKIRNIADALTTVSQWMQGDIFFQVAGLDGAALTVKIRNFRLEVKESDRENINNALSTVENIDNKKNFTTYFYDEKAVLPGLPKTSGGKNDYFAILIAFDAGSEYAGISLINNVLPASAHGILSAPPSAKSGSTVSVIASPEIGFELSSVTVTAAGGSAVSVDYNHYGNGATFVMPDKEVSVSAYFELEDIKERSRYVIYESVPEKADSAYSPIIEKFTEKGAGSIENDGELTFWHADFNKEGTVVFPNTANGNMLYNNPDIIKKLAEYIHFECDVRVNTGLNLKLKPTFIIAPVSPDTAGMFSWKICNFEYVDCWRSGYETNKWITYDEKGLTFTSNTSPLGWQGDILINLQMSEGKVMSNGNVSVDIRRLRLTLDEADRAAVDSALASIGISDGFNRLTSGNKSSAYSTSADFGDINGDGLIDVRDLVRIKKKAADSAVSAVYKAADYNSDKPRCSNELYFEKIKSYYNELMPRIKKHLFKNGGPIIAVQVENEYGSFGNDKEYISRLYRLMLSYELDTFFFTADGTEKYMLNGGLTDGVFATANFGSDPEGNFEALDARRPNQPHFCMEYWCGWFDHWGEKPHKRDAEDIVAPLKRMQERGEHFNIYMFHGGTNFGFMNGANYADTYQPTVTSYDYGAFLTENGEYTEQYRLLKNELSRYREDTDLPCKPIPLRSYGEIRLTESARLFDNLERISALTEDIKSIEELEEPLMHPHGKGCDYNSAPVYKNSWKETSTANVI